MDAVRTAAETGRVGGIETGKTGSEELTGLQVDIPAGLPAPEKPFDHRIAAIQEALADAEDLAALRTAKREERDAPTVALEEVVDDLGLHG